MLTFSQMRSIEPQLSAIEEKLWQIKEELGDDAHPMVYWFKYWGNSRNDQMVVLDGNESIEPNDEPVNPRYDLERTVGPISRNKNECLRTKEALDIAWQYLYGILDPSVLPRKFKTVDLRPWRSLTIDAGVYIIAAPDGIYKIGKADNVRARVHIICQAVPFPITVTQVLITDKSEIIEKRLHQRFSEKHVKGEWYRLSKDDIAYIKKLGRHYV